MELAKYEDEHEAVTTPSGLMDIPVVLRPPKPPFPWKTVGWCGMVALGVLAMSVCIAVTASFLVDLSYLGGFGYAAGVVASSASLGAMVASVAWSVRRPQ